MLFNTMQYIVYLLVVVIVYFVLPRKAKNLWLLIASYYFYMQWNALYILLLFSCTVLTYVVALLVDKLNYAESPIVDKERIKRLCMAVCILLNLGILGYFKYFEFGINCFNKILTVFNLEEVGWRGEILLPVGISFYILQALGYLLDVYRKNIRAERNFWEYALFVSFFPQLVAGPIERSKSLMCQLKEEHKFDYENFRRGILLVLYGLFLKMVIADRAAILVDTVYENTEIYYGFYVVVATLLFAIQIYCDFYGYSTIARGSALLLGINLMSNFEAPYYSKSVKEFWRRWHISLSSWFRDYLYIPLGGNRKGILRKEENLLIVFGISGLWHGASLGFLFWGILNGIYQVFSDFLHEIMRRISQMLPWTVMFQKRKNILSRRVLRTTVTFLLVAFAWIFFRAGGLHAAFGVIKDMLHMNNLGIFLNGSLFALGVSRLEVNFMLLAIICLFLVDYYKYKGMNVVELIMGQEFWFRYLIYAGLLFGILIFGCYGEVYDAQQFIYFQF